jgi:hypothetical protein
VNEEQDAESVRQIPLEVDPAEPEEAPPAKRIPFEVGPAQVDSVSSPIVAAALDQQ